jgi:hypothetical protein
MKRAVPDDELSFLAFCEMFGIKLFAWQVEAFGAAAERRDGRFVRHLDGISVPRGVGKSYAAAAFALWRLVCGPHRQDMISVALDYEGAGIVMDHARQMVERSEHLSRVVEMKRGELLVPSRRSRWTVEPRDHTSTRGRHPDLVVYDECGWAADDSLFSSLLAGQVSCRDRKMLVVSTVGKRKSGPLWTIRTLAEQGDPDAGWFYSSDSFLSPQVTREAIEADRRMMVPAQFAREHQNSWIDEADSFCTSEQVEAAMARIASPPTRGTPCHGFVDVGLVHDPSVIAVGHLDGDTVVIDHLQTYQGTKESPVRIDTLEAALLELAGRYNLTCIRIESWQGEGLVQRLTELGLPVEVLRVTQRVNIDEWPVLSQRLAAGTIILPRHARLREELLGLTVEVGPAGAKVSDRRSGLHQDHATAVRGVCASLGSASRFEELWARDPLRYRQERGEATPEELAHARRVAPARYRTAPDEPRDAQGRLLNSRGEVHLELDIGRGGGIRRYYGDEVP